MADEKEMALSKSVFDALNSHLRDDIGLKFRTSERGDDYVIDFIMNGDDIPMQFYVIVNTGKQALMIHSPQPVHFSKEQFGEAGIVLNAINYRLACGSFQLDISDGTVVFCMSTLFAGSLISNEVFDQMIAMAVHTVDDFNDKLMMLSKGMIEKEKIIVDMLHYDVDL
ncbi:MAG: YbjN domain-containing protein [Lachnospiraceae bacterium]|nr:YbjN domain-containing protein [Lachnospiraceae bacterium]